nr:hypothetical protein [Kofleriaceae bacterium]
MRAAIAILFLAGCDALLGIHHLDNLSDGSGASGSDAGTADAPAPVCLGSGAFTVCVTPPSAPLTLTGPVDTTACSGGQVAAVGSVMTCVLAGTAITIDGGVTIAASGSRPLVLVSTGDIDIAGTLDAGSHAGGQTGPAANGAECVPSSPGTAAADIDNGGGAGAGGSFATAGGAGGAGEASASGAGAQNAQSAPQSLAGGCPGSLGAAGAEPSSDACQPHGSDPAGAGGGVVALVATGTIRVDGAISVSGAGGGGGILARGGGAGGGTGGLIVAVATTITGAGAIVASGGGGGGGADHCGNGLVGGDGSTLAATGGLGGLGGTTDCPNGGDGASGGSASGAPGSAGGSKGGSAGGGGLGYILVHGSETVTGPLSGVVQPF